VRFDRTIKAGTGFLLAVKIVPNAMDEVASVTLNEGKAIKYEELHAMLGHPGEKTVRETAKRLSIEVSGKSKNPCEHCAKAKMRQKNIPKENENKTDVVGERLYVDISSIKSRSYGGNKFWCLAVDEATDQSFSCFVGRKSHAPYKLVKLIKELKDKGKIVKYIRCDNAGENYKLKELCEEEELGIELEFTAPGTPQQNGVVERKFATLFGRARSMLNNAGMNGKMREGLWAEAANTATLLENIVVHPGETKCPYEKFYGNLPNWMRYLRVFGEIGVVKEHGDIKGKLKNRGRLATFIGYPNSSHAGNVYRFFTLDKKSIILSRDVQWMRKMWGEFSKTKQEQDLVDLTDSDEDDIVEDEVDIEDEEEIEVPMVPIVGRAKNRVERELRRLHTYYNPTVKTDEESDDEEDDDESDSEAANILEYAFVSVLTGAMDPTKFEDAYDADDDEDREGWRNGIGKEFSDMKKRMVWVVMKKKDLPEGVRLLGAKWVFKKKKNGVYRARLVAKGYDQIPGVDYTENFAPVVNDVTIRTVLVLWLKNKHWVATLIDVETAFLYGDMDVELYMEIPEGMEHYEDVDPEKDCLLLRKTIYGTVQAARQWWKKFIKTLEVELGFERSKSDPCLLFRKDEKGTVIICIYVDDACLIGDEEAV
jgi:hypothetical protein